jgi:hypothetical protein
MRLLWAVSSVGLGHVMRDLAVVRQLRRRAAVEVDWLAPAPAGEFLRRRGCTVVPQSDSLLGSGRLYDRIFATRTDDFNLMEYVAGDTRLHRHDFQVSAGAWRDTDYDAPVADEAFWLLSGFASGWSPKPAPFVFLTDFIGTKAMTSRPDERLRSWYQNLRFTFSHRGPDAYVYIGSAGEIPNEPFGPLLPRRRGWAEQHCRFVKPVVGFDPKSRPERVGLRRRLGLPSEGPLFLAAVGPHGGRRTRTAHLIEVLDQLRGRHPDATFVLVGPEPGEKAWIRHHVYVEPLYEYSPRPPLRAGGVHGRPAAAPLCGSGGDAARSPTRGHGRDRGGDAGTADPQDRGGRRRRDRGHRPADGFSVRCEPRGGPTSPSCSHVRVAWGRAVPFGVGSR